MCTAAGAAAGNQRSQAGRAHTVTDRTEKGTGKGMKKNRTIHFSTNSATGLWAITSCGAWAGTIDEQSPITGQLNNVTCERCKRTEEYRTRKARSISKALGRAGAGSW